MATSKLRFSLRTALLGMLLVATYTAGWMSHKHFHNRNLKENVAEALDKIETKQAQVEVMEELDGLTVVKGPSQQAVADVISAIKKVEKAAKE